MTSIVKILRQNKFTISVELVPPRNGTNLSSIYDIVDKLNDLKVNFISVTHGAGGSLRGGTLPICNYAQNKFDLNAIAHLTVRSSSEADLENILIDHYYLGIKNILALRGDPPDGIQANFSPVKGGYSYAYQLVQLINNMRKGRYLIRQNFDKKNNLGYREGVPLDFCIGVASYPDYPDEIRIKYLKKKIDAGADFSITQMALSSQHLIPFLHEVQNNFKEFPLLPGIRIPNSYESLLRLRDKFGIFIDNTLLVDMKKASSSKEDMREVGLTWTINLTDQLSAMGVMGIHFFSMSDVDLIRVFKKAYEKY